MIVVEGSRALVRDLGSSGGTLVDGQKVSEAALRDGDRLTFGDEVFVFRQPSG